MGGPVARRYSRRAFIKQLAAFTVVDPARLLALPFQPPAEEPSEPPASRHPTTSAPEPRSLLFEHDGMGLAELIRTRQISAVELVEEVLRQVERLNPSINAVVPALFDPERARDRARQALGRRSHAGPLAGVPVMLKNLIDYGAARIDYGSRLYARAYARGTVPAQESSAFAAAIEAAGMIVTGITNSAEFGLIDSTEPVLHGATRNPWNLDYTAGGSSGGSAVVVAARIVPLAHGNDGAGSIRIPASHCGIFGLKPSRGREVGSGNPKATLNISSELCLSRSVRDTAAFLSEVENRDGGLPPVGFIRQPAKRRLRIALVSDSLLGVAPEPEVQRALLSATALCEQMGHQVREVRLSMDGEAFADAFIGLWATTTLPLETLVVEWLGKGAEPGDVLEPWTLGLLKLAKARGREACLLAAMEAFEKASARMESLFGQHDVMLSPVLRRPVFRLGVRDPKQDFDRLLERLRDEVAYTPLQNATGMTAMSVPLYWTADGLPVGIHFSAWRGQEKTLLELAYELEEARPWAGRVPRIVVH